MKARIRANGEIGRIEIDEYGVCKSVDRIAANLGLYNKSISEIKHKCLDNDWKFEEAREVFDKWGRLKMVM